ncbi:hypothetical protein PHET_00010 [Paragonimus heterotremus]|uniref:Uncharacterized protein n=1 Tax=Paragonimus heterotremus TaxID=100268 RepID=A0A8J4X3W3_9TREM|nr:hypothetical protein PHET_00010 [Paragonimus heterotremus]
MTEFTVSGLFIVDNPDQLQGRQEGEHICLKISRKPNKRIQLTNGDEPDVKQFQHQQQVSTNPSGLSTIKENGMN